MSLTRIEIFDRTVVVPVLRHLAAAEPHLYSLAARQLLVGTAVAESDLTHGLQLPNGPARSRFQIEPGTMRLIGCWIGRRASRHELVYPIAALLPDWLTLPAPDQERFTRLPEIFEGLSDHLTFDDHLGCAIARILYWSIPTPLPAPGDWRGQAEYWKRHYNSPAGKGMPEAFLARTAEVQRYFAGLPAEPTV